VKLLLSNLLVIKGDEVTFKEFITKYKNKGGKIQINLDKWTSR